MTDITSDITIRPYQPSDREKVRRICYVTGFMGQSVAFYWHDFTSFADIWTSYYTDKEPGSTFIAERDGDVVGYLTGCVNSSNASSPRSAIIHQMRKRWLLFRPGTAWYFWRSIWDILWAKDSISGELSDPRWPSHLHIDLIPEARGLGAGRELMKAWLSKLLSVGSPGCHLGTLAENKGAITFFCRMGFETYGPATIIPGLRDHVGRRLHQQLMVQSIKKENFQ